MECGRSGRCRRMSAGREVVCPVVASSANGNVPCRCPLPRVAFLLPSSGSNLSGRGASERPEELEGGVAQVQGLPLGRLVHLFHRLTTRQTEEAKLRRRGRRHLFDAGLT